MTADPTDHAPGRTRLSRPALRRWATIIVVVLVVGAVTVALVRGWSTVSEYDWKLRPGWLAAGCLLFVVAYAWAALAYSVSVQWLSSEYPPPRIAVAIWAKSILARYVPGNVMLIVGRAVMAATHGVPKRVTLTATIYEQALALGLATVGAVIYLAVYGNPGEGALLWLLAAVPLILAFMHPVPFSRTMNWVLRRTGRPELAIVFSVRQVGRLIAYYAVSQLLMVASVWALVRSAAGPAAGGMFEVGLAFLLAFVLSFLAFVLPSGIGVRDGVLALALSRHLPGEVALAVSVGLRFVMVLLEVAFTGLAIWVGRRG